MVKEEVSLTMWLYNKKNLEILKNLTQQESYQARIVLFDEVLYICTYGPDKDYHRAKDVNDAKEWWRKRHNEVYINDTI